MIRSADKKRAGQLLAARIPFLYRRAKRRGTFPLLSDESGRGKAKNLITQTSIPVSRAYVLHTVPYRRGVPYDVQGLADMVSHYGVRHETYGMRRVPVPHNPGRFLTDDHREHILRVARESGWNEPEEVRRAREATARRSPSYSPSHSPIRSPIRSPSYSPSHSPIRSPSRSPSRSPRYSPSRGPSSPGRARVVRDHATVRRLRAERARDHDRAVMRALRRAIARNPL